MERKYRALLAIIKVKGVNAVNVKQFTFVRSISI